MKHSTCTYSSREVLSLCPTTGCMAKNGDLVSQKLLKGEKRLVVLRAGGHSL